MSEQRYQTFEEFWPFYVREHSRKATRILHFIGTTAAGACALAFAVTRRPGWLLAMPLAGYGGAWVSHFFIEKNRPATFTYPAWSLKADFVMWSKMVAGTMDAEVEQAFAAQRAASEGSSSEGAGDAKSSRDAGPSHEGGHGTNGAARDALN